MSIAPAIAQTGDATVVSGSAVQPDSFRLFIVHSSGISDPWVAGFQRGLNAVLRDANLKVQLRVEYMDSSERSRTTADTENLYNYLVAQVKSNPSDVFIFDGIAAYHFAIAYQRELFSEHPVIVTGIMKDELTAHPLPDNFHVLQLNLGLDKTIRNCRRLNPQLKTLSVIRDATYFGRFCDNELIEICSKLDPPLHVEFLPRDSLDNMLKAAGKVPEDGAILMVKFSLDENQRRYQVFEMLPNLASIALAPVYVLWDYDLLTNVAGGVVASPRQYGALAAAQAIDIIRVPERVEHVIEPPSCQAAYNAAQLKRHRLDLEKIQPDNRVASRTPIRAADRMKKEASFNEMHIFAALVVLQALVIITLLLFYTFRRGVERQLRESEQRYRDLVENSVIPTFVHCSGAILYCNPAAVELFGVENEEQIIGKDFIAFLSEEQRNEERKRIASRKVYSHVHTRISRMNESMADLDLSSIPVVFSGKEACLVYCIDITQRKQAEARREKYADGMRSIVRAADQLLAFDDLDAMLKKSVELSREELKLERASIYLVKDGEVQGTYGTSAEGRTIKQNDVHSNLISDPAQFSPDNLDAPRWLAVNHAGQSPGPPSGKTEGQSAWGVTTPIKSQHELVGLFYNDSAITHTPLDPDQQDILAVFCSVLGSLIQAKLSEVSRIGLESQIMHAQKLESLGILAGGIAHDFNNLLVGIMGNTDLVVNRLPEDSDLRKPLKAVIDSSNRAADLCRQMLAYSGKGQFVIKDINLNEIVKDMSHLISASISKKVRLLYDLAANLPPVRADVIQIRQIIMNLITNASDAIGDREGSVTISTGMMRCSGEYLKQTHSSKNIDPGWFCFIEIADTGEGMDEETIPRIFEPFYTTKFTGRGLGLAATLGIVRGHKGAIRVFSKPGYGTTIKALFPAQEKTVAAAPAQKPEPATHTDAWKGRGRILVVDDEEMIRDVLKAMLSRLGFEAITAEDGLKGLSLFKQNNGRIACVILDLTMPKMNGMETYQEIRKISPATPIMITSGYTEQELADKHEVKHCCFLQKPYQIDKLRMKLRSLMDAADADASQNPVAS
ncbi:response regulator [Candidatus Sumerlaeota bacterium]|nr:response regulator [Candidatus Sumerlaeota bacterium]